MGESQAIDRAKLNSKKDEFPSGTQGSAERSHHRLIEVVKNFS
ncbi:hypothetical protein QUA00_25980 [Microcoleus sp. T2B6]